MILSELAACVEGARIVCGDRTAAENTKIGGLTADSRFCGPGDLFFCLTGGKTDSHAYAGDAEAAGAAAVVCERDLDLKIPRLIVPDSRRAMGLIASGFYGRPADRLKIIGITGTNGKTTTSYMLASILRRAGKQVAVVGTLGIYYGKKQIAPELTTPDPLFLHKIFADMVKCGVEYVVTEVSAHALFYHKDEGISYAACIFTNLTQDHLDFFDGMDSYKQAKKRLFDVRKCPVAVLNGDDPVGREIGAERSGFSKNAEGQENPGAPGKPKLSESGLRPQVPDSTHDNPRTIFYGLEAPSEVFAVVTSEDLQSCEFMLNLSDSLCRISLPMTGRHNVYNAMAAASAAMALGVRTEAIAGGLNEMKPVRGRLEWVGKYRGADIFVDFAHTPDGLEKSLSALKAHCKGRLLCLFGCGGNRDRSKRAPMGETVAKRADFGILTSDNPRFEEPTDIIAEIEKGYRRISDRYVVIPERERAIRYAVGILKKGDVLLVAGKGGEDYQEIMGIKYSYNDNAVIREAMSRRPPL